MGGGRRRLSWVGMLVAVVLLLLALSLLTGTASAAGADDKWKEKGALDPASTHYRYLETDAVTGQEKVNCLARGRCHGQNLTCPAQCPQRKPRRNRVVKGCFIDCSSRCETTCKYRKARCNGYGSMCYDPRFVGGDGVMFYFHGAKGGDFAVVSDDNLHINAHFIGTRPQGRTRDFTWIQALALMFEEPTRTLVIAAKRVAKWDDGFDALAIRWDGQEITIPTDGDQEWRTTTEGEGREVVIERTDQTNSIRVTVSGLVEMDVKVTPITEKEDQAHGYHLPSDDAFAHLETQFRFANLTDKVEGVLGLTYRPGYVSPVKVGVPMPMMGGEDRYRTPSFLSSRCVSCRFHHSIRAADESAAITVAQY